MSIKSDHALAEAVSIVQHAIEQSMQRPLDEADFVARREARDRTFGRPTLLLHSIQVNIRCGQVPDLEPIGVRYRKLPLNAV